MMRSNLSLYLILFALGFLELLFLKFNLHSNIIYI
jgi:hypothetical protein